MSREKFKELNDVLKLAVQQEYQQAGRELSYISRASLSDTSKITYDKVLAILLKKNGVQKNKHPKLDLQLKSGGMSIESNNSLVYCILAMEHEVDVLKMAISPLIQQLQSLDSIYILFNGFKNYALKVHFEKHVGIIVWESSSNLGVAGGRNLLYAEAFKDQKSFDYIVTLDNDVIVPNDFNTVIKNELDLNYAKNNTGIMGSVILDYKKQKVKKFVSDNFLSFPGYLSSINFNIFTDDIKKFIADNANKLSTVLWHIGMDKNYQDTYVDRVDLHQNFSNQTQTFFPFLAHAPQNKILISQNLFEVSNIPGCFQVISLENLKKAGFLNDKFSPYFFEDSEFSIRLMKMGMKNYISTKIALFHGTDNRHNDRKKVSSKFEFIANEYRARMILFDKLCVENSIKKLVVQSILKYSLEHNSAKALAEFVASLVGIRRGMIQLGMVEDIGDELHNDNKFIREGVDQLLSKRKLTESTHKPIKFDKLLPPADKNLPQVYFSKFKKFRNIYEGQDCLIVCNGPSLKDTNLGLFTGIPTFCVNSTFILQEQLDFIPDFFTVEDNHVINDNLSNIIKIKSGVKFFPDKYREKFGDEDNIYYLPTIWDCYWKSKLSHEYPEFSEDIARSIFTGQTVTYLNLQIAYYLGFKRVFIVGLDFSYSIPKGSKVDNNSIDHDDDDPNHFHANYFGKGRQWHFPKLDSCMSSYSIAKERFERSGREVIDLTKNGCLNVFRKSTIEKELCLEKRPEPVDQGLSFRQYLIDFIYIKNCRNNDKTSSFLVHKDKLFLPTRGRHTQIWLYSSHSEFTNALISAIGHVSNNRLVMYMNEKVIVSSDILDSSQLPFCNWLSSKMNTKYVELTGFYKEQIEFLTKYYILFFPNNSQGISYLQKVLDKSNKDKLVVYADSDKLLIKSIN